MKTDIEIAQSVELKPITEVVEKVGIGFDDLELYGKYKAKLSFDKINAVKDNKPGKLILVTAINPTPAGEGKSTMSIGLADALNKIGKKTMIALREPSLGPVMGIKGGAAGGGYAQVLPMEDINLHFTGDMHAITTANNALSALLDNHIHQGNALGIDQRRIIWKRVVDLNDRALRHVNVGLGGPLNGIPREDGFDITVASEIMAILCLATDIKDLKERLANIVVAYRYDRTPVYVRDLEIEGALTLILKDAIKPNLVQTIYGTPALVHGGPFANIAHGCNSVMATKLAMTFGDYVITEAGFGADLGAEKFYDIKCRKSGLQPKLTIIVATAQGLKMHGGVSLDQIKEPNAEGLTKGLANLDKHIENLRSFGQTVVVAFNRYANDTEEEIDLVRQHCAAQGIGFAVNNAFVEGGNGAVELANLVVDTIENQPSEPLRLVYNDDDTVEEKISKVACNLYGANMITYSAAAKKKLKRIQELGYGHFPICIAKTQYSFSTDPKLYGVVKDFEFHVRDIVLNAGAEMLVIIAGEIMRMPGLPKEPQALHIDIVNGEIEGLS